MIKQIIFAILCQYNVSSLSDCTYIYITPNDQIHSKDYCSTFIINKKDPVNLYAHFEKRCTDNKSLKVQWYRNGIKYKISESNGVNPNYFTSVLKVTENGIYKVAIILDDESLQNGCGFVEVNKD